MRSDRNRASKRLYYSIGEVCEMLDLEAHVLRYWENEFRLLKPGKNRAGKRVYKDKDIRVIRLIKFLVYDEGFTIDGADRKLRRMSESSFSNSQTELTFDIPSGEAILKEIKQELIEVRALLDCPPPKKTGKKKQ